MHTLVSGQHPAHSGGAEQPGRVTRPLSWLWSESCSLFTGGFASPSPQCPVFIRGGLCHLSRVSAGT